MKRNITNAEIGALYALKQAYLKAKGIIPSAIAQQEYRDLIDEIEDEIEDNALELLTTLITFSIIWEEKSLEQIISAYNAMGYEVE